jgi:protoporphyrin/coproporphyrin ferrochelatase
MMTKTMNTPGNAYDALLVVSFGGPEKPEDVLPFLENVLRGRNVPRERLLEVAAHYDHFEGKSPINAQVRELIAALRTELERRNRPIPIYWGNRNWYPFLTETLVEMTRSGVRRALALVLSAYSSYSGCRQYLENISQAQSAAGPGAPQVDKLRAFFNHPLFLNACTSRLNEALERFGEEQRDRASVAFTAHSIPGSMSRNCQYEQQLLETCRLVAEQAGIAPERWKLVYQSRSGRPEDPWLEPDILDHLRALAGSGAREVLIAPVGFLSDHLEVLYDLDVEARQVCDELGLFMVRAATAGTHPEFVRMLADLIDERQSGQTQRAAVGKLPACPDVCPADCCPSSGRPRAS